MSKNKSRGKMNELKTLKDIQLEKIHMNTRINTDDIRQEAIKWIKEELDDDYTSEFSECDSIINWIKHFFNISDKELKLEEDGE